MGVMYEKDIEFELVPVDMGGGGHKQPEFLAMNPFAQIPVLQDEDLTLFESRCITNYPPISLRRSIIAHRFVYQVSRVEMVM
ncbi:glutathione transferase [Ranunculus cassubicifolius]